MIVVAYFEKAKTNSEDKLKEDFLAKSSTLLLEQIRTIDKRRLIKKMGSLSKQSQERIDQVLDKNFYI